MFDVAAGPANDVYIVGMSDDDFWIRDVRVERGPFPGPFLARLDPFGHVVWAVTDPIHVISAQVLRLARAWA